MGRHRCAAHTYSLDGGTTWTLLQNRSYEHISALIEAANGKFAFFYLSVYFYCVNGEGEIDASPLECIQERV